MNSSIYENFILKRIIADFHELIVQVKMPLAIDTTTLIAIFYGLLSIIIGNSFNEG